MRVFAAFVMHPVEIVQEIWSEVIHSSVLSHIWMICNGIALVRASEAGVTSKDLGWVVKITLFYTKFCVG